MSRITLALLILAPAISLAEVGDPTIRTNHPDYPGEGAFQSVEDCVRFAIQGKSAEQEKAIALYLWMLKHQYHLMSPQERCVPGRTPDTAKPGDYEMVVFDANRARFSYGYGLCGTVHAWNEPYWHALGMRARRRAFPGHVNSEVRYGGSWHAFDTDMAGLLFRKDGGVAGYDDIIRDPSLVDSAKAPLPHYPFAWPSDFDTMKRGWQEIAKSSKQGKSWYSLYNSGYAAHPGIVHLRDGESLTRWFDRDHYGGPAKRRFWHHLKGGPQRHWTYMNAAKVFHDGDKSNSRNLASYGNGEFVYQVPLHSKSSREGMAEVAANVGHRKSSPKLHSTTGETTSVTFRHFSPYVIAGDPEDDANPMSAPASGGLVIEGKVVGNVPMNYSANDGLSWNEVEYEPDADGRFRIDLTEQVKGSYGWRIAATWSGKNGIDELRFTTVTQVAQGIYPRLTPGGSQVTYRSGSRGVAASLPNFSLPDAFLEKLEVLEQRSANVERRYRGRGERLGYRTTDNKPGQVVFKVESRRTRWVNEAAREPQPLLEVRAAVRYQLRVPPPEKTDYRLEVSTDGGQIWRTFAAADIPSDNEFSSGWLSGRANIAAAQANQALVRVTMYAGGHRTGLIDAQFYGVHRTAAPQPLKIEYGWKENGELKTFATEIPAGAAKKTFTVPTGKKIIDEFVRLSAFGVQ